MTIGQSCTEYLGRADRTYEVRLNDQEISHAYIKDGYVNVYESVHDFALREYLGENEVEWFCLTEEEYDQVCDAGVFGYHAMKKYAKKHFGIED